MQINDNFICKAIDKTVILVYNNHDSKIVIGEVNEMQMVNKRIARFRKKAKLSQSQLAKAVGVSRCAVSAWEVGRATPKAIWLKPLAKALSCQIRDLI